MDKEQLLEKFSHIIENFSSEDDSYLQLVKFFENPQTHPLIENLVADPKYFKILNEISSMSVIKDMPQKGKKIFLDACECGDLEIVKITLPGIPPSDRYQGIRNAIKNKHFNVLDCLLDNPKDPNLFCNVWPIISRFPPEDPIVQFVIRKENNINGGLMNACEVGNVALVNYMLSQGADDYQSGLNKSVRGNCFELVKKFVELAKPVKLDINMAAHWITFNEPDPDILDYLEKQSPGCIVAGTQNIMSLLFGLPLVSRSS